MKNIQARGHTLQTTFCKNECLCSSAMMNSYSPKMTMPTSMSISAMVITNKGRPHPFSNRPGSFRANLCRRRRTYTLSRIPKQAINNTTTAGMKTISSELSFNASVFLQLQFLSKSRTVEGGKDRDKDKCQSSGEQKSSENQSVQADISQEAAQAESKLIIKAKTAYIGNSSQAN
jgi:hypothetical protein